MVKVKICANRSIEDAKMSLDAKADIIGILTFLAGGLNPENVAEAIKISEPYGVDVNSWCKYEKGLKDAEKVKQFVYNAKNI